MSNNSSSHIQKVSLAVLTACLIAVIGWVVNQTHINTVESAEIKQALKTILQKVDDGKEARLKSERLNEDAHVRVEAKLEGIISKREFDIKMQSLEGEIRSLSARVSSVEARMN